MPPLRQGGYRERHDQQDGHASEREGASALQRHHLARSSPMTGSHGDLPRQLLANAAIAASRVGALPSTTKFYGTMNPPKRAVVSRVKPFFTIATFSSGTLFTITVTGPENSTI
jgi:hypothetical protein